MEKDNLLKAIRFHAGEWRALQREPAREFPLRLTVNDRELVTLIASPHQLIFLVAGFLLLQGFIEELDDLLSLGICEEHGIAEIRTKQSIPGSIRPTLTSGCGSGITFERPDAMPPIMAQASATGQRTTPEEVFTLMRALFHRAGLYHDHGGIHSTAVADGDQLLIFAEDIGRHNTLDRIAGEALINNISLTDRILVTSGRVSSEMVAKAARLGIVLIASRTSPTDMAVRMCREWGITLLGYVRADSLNVYSCPERMVGAGRQDHL